MTRICSMRNNYNHIYRNRKTHTLYTKHKTQRLHTIINSENSYIFYENRKLGKYVIYYDTIMLKTTHSLFEH